MVCIASSNSSGGTPPPSLSTRRWVSCRSLGPGLVALELGEVISAPTLYWTALAAVDHRQGEEDCTVGASSTALCM